MTVAVSLAVLIAVAFLADLAVLRICRGLRWQNPVACAIPLFLGIGLTTLAPTRILRGAAYGLILGGVVALAAIARGNALRRK